MGKKKKKTVRFPLHLRIPGWCKEGTITVNGKPFLKSGAGDIAVVEREWKSGDVVNLDLPMEVSVSRWYERSAVVERGPLVYALRIGEDWRKVEDDRKFGDRYGDWYYEVFPTSPWNYCLIEDHVNACNTDNHFKVVEKPVQGYPWNPENAPVEIHAKGKRMKEWTLYNGSAGPLPLQHSISGGDFARGRYRSDSVWMHHTEDHGIPCDKKIKSRLPGLYYYHPKPKSNETT